MEELKEWLKLLISSSTNFFNSSMEELKEWLKPDTWLQAPNLHSSMEELKEWLKRVRRELLRAKAQRF